ncbi:MAG TPA: hypothetical protein DEQ17_07770 [Prevotella sp.]|nr:hypothetical protein [Prevotella sp.]
MDIAQLIKQPELLDRETLYDLRSLLALYPYYQTARLLLLQNLYLLHDPTFDEELRRAAIYITDRKVIFNLVEAAHYQMRHAPAKPKDDRKKHNDNRTISLIDNFLETIPEEEKEADKKNKRKPTPADAAVDYVSYLLESESEEEKEAEQSATPQLKGQDLIDNFINNENGKIKLKTDVEYMPEDAQAGSGDDKNGDESYFTETLAKIYIKQGRYNKALEIIRRLNLNYPKKNAYFADQMRFLEKLILNDKNKSTEISKEK